MTDKEYAKQRNRIKKIADTLIKPLGFSWFTITLEYKRRFDYNDTDIMAKCHAQPDYMMATIEFFVPSIVELSDEELKHVILHELCHLLVAPIFHNPSKQTFEQSTELVTRALETATMEKK